MAHGAVDVDAAARLQPHRGVVVCVHLDRPVEDEDELLARMAQQRAEIGDVAGLHRGQHGHHPLPLQLGAEIEVVVVLGDLWQPLARFPGIDPVLSPEMKSTGEVMGIASDFATAFLKSQQGAGLDLPTSGTLFVSVKDSDKPIVVPAVEGLLALGFHVIATGCPADYLAAQGLAVERVNKVAQGRPHIVDRIKDGGIDMIFNTTEGWQSLKDSQPIRQAAVAQKIPHFTTASASVEAAKAIVALATRSLEVRSLQSYHSHSHN